jgi:hypothetical protein
LIGATSAQTSNPTPHLAVTTGGANIQSAFNPFQPNIYLGDFFGSNTGTASSSFYGIIKDFKMFSIYINNDYMFYNRFRRNFDFSADQPYLVAYWQLNEANTLSGTVTLIDHSIVQLTKDIVQGTEPQMIDSNLIPFNGQLGLANLRTQLTLCKMQDLYTCIGKSFKVL